MEKLIKQLLQDADKPTAKAFLAELYAIQRTLQCDRLKILVDICVQYTENELKKRQ